MPTGIFPLAISGLKDNAFVFNKKTYKEEKYLAGVSHRIPKRRVKASDNRSPSPKWGCTALLPARLFQGIPSELLP